MLDRWYPGVVIAVRETVPPYLVRYDDDEVYWERADWIRVTRLNSTGTT